MARWGLAPKTKQNMPNKFALDTEMVIIFKSPITTCAALLVIPFNHIYVVGLRNYIIT